MKVSNIPIPGLDGGLHGNHRAIERRLAASPVAATVLAAVVLHDGARPAARPHRPGPGRVAVRRGTDRVGRSRRTSPRSRPRRSRATSTDPLRITGPEALDGDEVAARLGVRRLDPPLARVARRGRRRRARPVAGRLDRRALRRGRARRARRSVTRRRTGARPSAGARVRGSDRSARTSSRCWRANSGCAGAS